MGDKNEKRLDKSQDDLRLTTQGTSLHEDVPLSYRPGAGALTRTPRSENEPNDDSTLELVTHPALLIAFAELVFSSF